jgi:hypothetical protein
MSKAEEHYKAVQEGILRARLIKQDLHEHPTEYYPKKVRGLVKAYIDTTKQVIQEGEKFIDTSEDFERGLEVAQIIENYRALHLKLRK